MTQVVRTRAELESVLHGVSVGSAAVDAVPAGSGGGGAVPAGSGGGAVPAGSGGGAVSAGSGGGAVSAGSGGSAAGGAVPAGSAAGGAVPAGSAAGGALSTGRGRVALVPTMGALHAGHRSLMGEARRRVTEDGALVVSIFVNPLQFGPGEDFDRYPRAFDADVAICEEQGVDVVFAPSVDEVYPGGDSAGSTVTVDPGPLATVLEGRFRPSHFRGVLTVVAKLFGLVRPDLAVFGEKDYQQLVLIRRMVADLCMPVDVVGAETVREDGGLAMSSRNAYLTEGQRTAALGLSRALRAAADAAPAGADHALAAAHAVLRGTPGVDLDYLEITSPDLGPPPERGEARALIAARVGTTRLIDNVAVHLGVAG